MTAQALGADDLGEARREALDHVERGLGGDVARRKAGAAGRQDEVELKQVGPLDQLRRDLVALVGHDRGFGHVNLALSFRRDRRPPLTHGPRQRRPAQILALAAKATIADGQDPNTHTVPPSGNKIGR